MNTMIFLSTQQVLIQLYNIYLLLLVTTLNVAFNYKEQLLNVHQLQRYPKAFLSLGKQNYRIMFQPQVLEQVRVLIQIMMMGLYSLRL